MIIEYNALFWIGFFYCKDIIRIFGKIWIRGLGEGYLGIWYIIYVNFLRVWNYLKIKSFLKNFLCLLVFF